MTHYGRRATEHVVEALVDTGLIVVSGLAVGIDTVAHRAALAAGGRTVAVLACGVDVAYPRQNARLCADVAASGAVVSEYPPGMPAVAGNFPARNRIIAGLSLATVVVEAGLRSGALITADLALSEGREVFAVPGSIFSKVSQGPNRMIEDGGQIATSGHQIAARVAALTGATSATPGDTPDAAGRAKAAQLELPGARLDHTAGGPSADERALLRLLQAESMHADELVDALGLSASQVAQLLTYLEIRGLAIHIGGMRWTHG
jgi:DNA processing protein